MKILHTADWHIGQFKGPIEDGVNLRSLDTIKCLEYQGFFRLSAECPILQREPDTPFFDVLLRMILSYFPCKSTPSYSDNRYIPVWHLDNGVSFPNHKSFILHRCK